MKNGFLKFKKKMFLEALIKSLIGGLAFGLVAFASFLTLSKQAILPLELPITLLIGIGAFLLFGGVCFLLIRPSDKKAAAILDSELMLNEKVKTMVELQKEDGGMIELQRQDTDNRLMATPKKALKVKHLLHYGIGFALSLALCITAFAIPAKGSEQPSEPEDPPFVLTGWQETALLELIETVKTSTMTEAARNEAVASLEGLLAELRNTDTVSKMKASVVKVITDTDLLHKKLVTYKAIAAQLKASGFMPALELGQTVEVPISPNFKQDIQTVREMMLAKEMAEDESVFSENLRTYSSEIKLALTKAAGGEGDPLTVALKALADGMTGIADGMTENVTVEQGQKHLDEAFDTAAEAIENALLQQEIDKSICEHIIATLMEVFEITANDLPKVETQLPGDFTNTDEEYPDPNDDMQITDGGLGDGKTHFGSNDEIYDTEKGHVAYGDVYAFYAAILDAAQRDELLTPEMNQIISSYFDILKQKNEDKQDD